MFESPNLKVVPAKNQPEWGPGIREEYSYYRKAAAPQEIAQVAEQFKENVTSYWERAIHNPGAGMAVLGANLGKAFIKSCQVEGDIKFTGKSAPKKYYDELAKLFGPRYSDETNKMLGGFLGEYSLAQELVSQRAYEVYLPNDKPGEEYEEGKGIDLWINLANGTDDREEEEGDYIGMATQVKCATFSRELIQHLYPLRSPRDIDYLMNKIITPQNILGTYNFEHTGKSLEKLLEYSTTFSNVVPAVALFNTPGQDADRDVPHINRATGRMSDAVAVKVMDDIEGIKDWYLSIREKLQAA